MNLLPLKPQPEAPQLPAVTYHVIGRVERRTCSNALKGATLQVTEFWYTLKGGGDTTLVLPAHPTSGLLDPLSKTGTSLVQRHVLGEALLTADATNFDVDWLERPVSFRVPWLQNVQNGRTGEIITVYRLLSLQVNFDIARRSVAKIDPVPLIMFFGAETTKDVGTIKLDCFDIGG